MNSLHNSATIYNCLKKLKLGTFISDVNIKHIIAIILSVFTIGFKGKTLNFASVSDCHRTTVAHFLNKGKWDSDKLLQTLKSNFIEIIYNEAHIMGENVITAIYNKGKKVRLKNFLPFIII